jgi:hypothetical protein
MRTLTMLQLASVEPSLARYGLVLRLSSTLSFALALTALLVGALARPLTVGPALVTLGLFFAYSHSLTPSR